MTSWLYIDRDLSLYILSRGLFFDDLVLLFLSTHIRCVRADIRGVNFLLLEVYVHRV